MKKINRFSMDAMACILGFTALSGCNVSTTETVSKIAGFSTTIATPAATPTPHASATPILNPTSTPILDPTPRQPTPTPTQPTPTPPTSGVFPASGFPASSFFFRDVSNAAVDPNSANVISTLQNSGGFGGGKLQIDFSFHVLTATSSTPNAPVVKNSGYYSPDCDNVTTFPLPAGGAIEGASDYTCDGGDCHLLVLDYTHKTLWESYNSSVSGGSLHSLCVVKWDMTKNYSDTLRGDQCTSVDAGGFPVAPMLFTADEVAAGSINHAIRFILPNAKMAKGIYVRPATHAGGPSGATANAVPYGATFRLRADYPISTLPSKGAQVVARALQKYGMILADGGNIALTAMSDQYSTAKWTNVLGSQDLKAIQASDFQMIGQGMPITLTYDCVRNP